jgi:hypothetical protein
MLCIIPNKNTLLYSVTFFLKIKNLIKIKNYRLNDVDMLRKGLLMLWALSVVFTSLLKAE